VLKRYLLVLSHHDRSGVIKAFGPYDTEDEARSWQGEVADLIDPGSGVWDVIPLYSTRSQ
jgi:hypothetical protein